jgi:hypothetical protein
MQRPHIDLGPCRPPAYRSSSWILTECGRAARKQFLYHFKGGGYAGTPATVWFARLGQSRRRACGRRQAAVLGPRASPAAVARRADSASTRSSAPIGEDTSRTHETEDLMGNVANHCRIDSQLNSPFGRLRPVADSPD